MSYYKELDSQVKSFFSISFDGSKLPKFHDKNVSKLTKHRTRLKMALMILTLHP